ncbi:Rv1733c family protein [Phytoactinopolyspora halotolerans]|uniref:Uncharacterized protein n=1 Tax=Phytoactinopolyspora halotolerans TaxID=1981512 RepID=A0A6L9S618_9ACTN|nr:hypothetical protein [Phytoactinopolyspora halotolerans]NEE00596.1 hypothetical protein [Phytoactinopolyspora halotolerans]
MAWTTVSAFARRFGIGRCPLRRPWGRLEAVLTGAALVAALMAVPVAAATGTAAHQQAMREAAEQETTGFQTVAVLTADAVPKVATTPAGTTVRGPVLVEATWRTAGGQQREGYVVAEAGTVQGTEVSVWLDENGDPSEPPLSAGQSVSSAVALSLRWLVVAETLIIGGWWMIRSVLVLLRVHAWGTEWAHVEPRWSREMGFR